MFLIWISNYQQIFQKYLKLNLSKLKSGSYVLCFQEWRNFSSSCITAKSRCNVRNPSAVPRLVNITSQFSLFASVSIAAYQGGVIIMSSLPFCIRSLSTSHLISLHIVIYLSLILWGQYYDYPDSAYGAICLLSHNQ